MWSRIDDYYRIRSTLNDLTRTNQEHCGLCYAHSCQHGVERVSYEDCLTELNMLSDIALQEYPGSYLLVGEVAVYPAWPIAQEFQNHYDFYPYRVFPKIKNGVFGGIVSHNNGVTGYNPDLTINDQLTNIGNKISRFGDGMYWGYALDDDFYVMRLFRQSWMSIRRKTLPYKDVIGLTIPDLDNFGSDIEGWHFIPLQVHKNVDFQTRYFEL